MNLLAEIRSRFDPVLTELAGEAAPLLDMIRPSQDAKFGDYQANFAMPLGKQLGKPPREMATQVVAKVELADLCQPPEIAGPGFINLRLQDEFLAQQLSAAVQDERLGVPLASPPKTIVIDYSSPNVAKPMHVGHIRSTVIGDSLYRTLQFLGHNVISDNHLGDWGTQFGMIIYGWKHFGDQAAYQQNPVTELSRVYRFVRKLMDYFEARRKLPALTAQIEKVEAELARSKAAHPAGETKADKKAAQLLRKLDKQKEELSEELTALGKKIDEANGDASLAQSLIEHAEIENAVLAETAKLHEGDAENLRLWHDFLPACRQDIQRIYERLKVRFDHELGESFYHDQLAPVVADLEKKGLARQSEGATCVFLDGFETPMIVRKRDGAFLYSTTDLATIAYRLREWKPDIILYVVDHRQSEHFEKLFAAVKLWGYGGLDLRHIKFGTVQMEVQLPDGRTRVVPFKTRSGDTVGLEGLLDDAVDKAYGVVCELDDKKKDGPQLNDKERKQVAWVIGHAAIKYADLSQNRESDYVFSFDKMVALDGNTAPYMMYAYARVHGIFAKGEVDIEKLRASQAAISVSHPAERALGLALLRFAETLESSVLDYRPNLLTDYLYDLAKAYSVFFENCPVLKAETPALRDSRLLLCDLTARTLRQGLSLLGIDVVERM